MTIWNNVFCKGEKRSSCPTSRF